MNTEPLATASDRITLLTPPGRGALAVVGLAGPAACRLADMCFQPRGGSDLVARSNGAICFGQWQSTEGTAGEDLIVVKHANDRLEIHCHGGHAASEAVMASLERRGALRQTWVEWLAGNGIDPIELEARQAMSRVAGPRAARILARQASGCLRDELALIATKPIADRMARIHRLLATSKAGLRLTDPWRVVLAGRVNAGKSSLANAIAGYSRSIVSAEPGTTRDVVTTRLVLGGFDVELFDTAGLRDREASISNTERAGIERAELAAKDADLVLRVFPADELGAFSAESSELVVITKADLAPAGFLAPDDCLLSSTVTGRGIAELVDAIVARLIPELQSDSSLLDGPVLFTERQVAAVRDLAREHGSQDDGS